MKLEEMRYREIQELHFGKRGMSYHGAVIYVNREATSATVRLPGVEVKKDAHPYQMYFFDDLVGNSQRQDSVAAVSLMEATLARTHTMFPHLMTCSLQSDNAATYASPFVLLMMPAVAARYRLRVTAFIHNEAGDGKTVLDGHFGVQTQMMKVSVTMLTTIYN
jgi:hypothetical protein